MKAKEEKIIEFIKQHKIVNVWWMSDFYEMFCELYNLNFNDILRNQSKMRYRLNKLCKLGLLEKRETGSGFLGKTDFGATHQGSWGIKGIWD